MAKPGKIYRIQCQSFHETEDIQVYVDLSDNDFLIPDEDTPQVFDLTPSGDPFRLSVIDNDENPFKPIRAQQATIQFLSDNNFSMQTFASGSDQRWGVHAYITNSNRTIFKGHLVLDDLQEAFMPNPNIVTLVANDGLGLLRDVKLVNADGENPVGRFRISDILTWCLRQTGLELKIRAAFNIKRSVHVTDISVASNSNFEHFFYNIYLDAKTFEDEIGTCIDCYSVIERILGFEACLFQFQGYWWIVRVDEVEDATRGLYLAEFDTSGSLTDYLGEYDLRKEIGRAKDIFFADAATLIKNERPAKAVRLDYRYEYPAEIPCNSNFTRGDFVEDLSATEKTYQLECWTLREGVPGYYGTVDGTTVRIHRIFNTDDYETERYIKLTPRSSFESSTINDVTYIESEAIEVSEGDKFSASVDWRLASDIGTGGNGSARLLRCVLKGDDGTWWILGEDTTGDGNHKWFNTSLWTVNTAKGVVSLDYDITDESDWQNVTWNAAPVPVTGKVYLWLNQFNQLNSSEDDVDIWYSNLSFTYNPLINGSYRQFQGQYHEVTQDGNYKKRVEGQVYISDSPKKLFKGALFYYDDSDEFQLENSFYNAATHPTGPPDSTFIKPYGEIQAFDVWNQYRLPSKIIQGTMQGCDLEKLTGENLVDMAHLSNKWNPTDSSPYVINKYFLLLSFDMSMRNQGWTGTFREVVDLTASKNYTGHEFKYIEQ